MNAVFLGQLRQRHLLTDRFKRNLGFELWRMVLSFLHSGSLLSSCDPPYVLVRISATTSVRHVDRKNLNSRIESDYASLKQRLRPMRGYKRWSVPRRLSPASKLSVPSARDSLKTSGSALQTRATWWLNSFQKPRERHQNPLSACRTKLIQRTRKSTPHADGGAGDDHSRSAAQLSVACWRTASIAASETSFNVCRPRNGSS